MTDVTPTIEQVRARRSTAEGLRYFDSLPAVTVEEMLGRWRGEGVGTGHPMDGVLERFGWYGKRFEGPDDVHPLVFRTSRGLRSVNPALMPVGLLAARPRTAFLPGAAGAFRLLLPLVTTSRPAARLRMTEYRGVVTATMCYDAHPIHDVFRRVDGDTVLGVMDQRGLPQPFVFLLRRER
ncbi:DUF4334 domain-containing protein [Kineosporia sp. R_H_3]|uniref:DUF4334 domain-containing protein n=1 Tax=Kineosporia sp. R_H_3 TaxID=1961848 RepID=UPI0018EA0CA0|nr:DUF4334 domain-containing protein [Kineosporia sp. R_H_3]